MIDLVTNSDTRHAQETEAKPFLDKHIGMFLFELKTLTLTFYVNLFSYLFTFASQLRHVTQTGQGGLHFFIHVN